MKFSKFTKKFLCSFALGLSLVSTFNIIDANAAKVTCRSGKLPIQSTYSDEEKHTVGNFYKGEYFYTDSSYNMGTTAYFIYKAYSGNTRYVNYYQPNGTYSVS